MPKREKDENINANTDIDEGIEKELKKYEKTDYENLIKQIQVEYDLAWWFMKPKLDEWALRLKLYNNQKKNKTAIGDPLLFTIHQTALASLYNDRLAVRFLGRESGDEETAENLNFLADFDYDDMGLDEIDYEWDFDSSFYGRGLLLMSEFDRKLKLPCPEVIDMMTWLRDPRAISVNGDRKGRGAMRFGGREIRLTKGEMEKAGIYFNFDDIKFDSSNLRSLIDQMSQARAEAQGMTDVSRWKKLTGENGDHRLVEWFTTWKGKKVIATLADNRKRIVRYTELDNKDMFPILDRPIYPMSHSWDGVSIPDIIEDKQRARASIQNLALKGIKVGLNPTYVYDTNKIKNRAHLNVDFNKHIPVDGNPTGAVQVVDRQAVKAEVQWILEVLNTASERATATPDIQQGVSTEEKRTATETNLISAKVDKRYSLSAKIWGWSEKRRWSQWYFLYKKNFKEGIDDKVVRIAGAMGSKWRTLTRENIIANIDPDIKIESKVISDAHKFNDLQKYRLFLKDVLAVDPQNSNVRFALRKVGRLSGFRKEEVEQILPPTIDEMTAEEENEKLNNGEMVMVQVYDDDFVHLVINSKANDNPQTKAHIKAHRKAMMLKRIRPEFDMTTQNRPQAPEEVQSEKVMFSKENVPVSGSRQSVATGQ